MRSPGRTRFTMKDLHVVVLPEPVCGTRPEKEVQTMHHKTLLFATLMFLLIMIPVFSPASSAQAAREPSVKAAEPGSHFQKADELFLKKDFKRAASEIRKGAGFLRQKAKSATKDSKEGREIILCLIQSRIPEGFRVLGQEKDERDRSSPHGCSARHGASSKVVRPRVGNRHRGYHRLRACGRR